MYRKGGEQGAEETVIALEAATGKTKWEHRYSAPLPSKMNAGHGPGPHATPLIVRNRLFSIGATGKLRALDKQTGEVLWARDVYEEFGLKRVGMKTNRGYASSPLAYKDTLILPLGGPGQAVAAFDQKDGGVVWKNQNFELSPSSPVLIENGGETQLVCFLASEVVGLDPEGGELLWSYPHEIDYQINALTPVWGDDGLLFISTAYSGGSQMLRIPKPGANKQVEQLWFTKRMRIHFGIAIRLGDVIYGSSGDFGPAFLTAVRASTGEILSRQRGLAKAQMIFADGKFIMMAEDGTLALARPTQTGFEILSRAQIFDSRSWTVPTLVGTTLYVRDRSSIVALDLSP
jgi:outer membrane protein assembly factor BamB